MACSTPASQSSQWVTLPEAPLPVFVHPTAARGIADGGLATLQSVLGSLPVRVHHDARQHPEVVRAAKGGHLDAGLCANALIQARLTDLGEGGALYDEPVALQALEPETD